MRGTCEAARAIAPASTSLAGLVSTWDIAEKMFDSSVYVPKHSELHTLSQCYLYLSEALKASYLMCTASSEHLADRAREYGFQHNIMLSSS